MKTDKKKPPKYITTFVFHSGIIIKGEDTPFFKLCWSSVSSSDQKHTVQSPRSSKEMIQHGDMKKNEANKKRDKTVRIKRKNSSLQWMMLLGWDCLFDIFTWYCVHCACHHEIKNTM